MSTGSWNALRAMVWKDVAIELRRRSDLWVSAGFTMAVSVLVSSGLYTADNPALGGSIGAVLTALFISLFTGFSAFTRETYKGTLDGLRVSPVERWMIVAAKTIVISMLILPHMLFYAILVYVFTPGFSVEWVSYLLWMGATTLFLSSITAFVSAALSFGEARTGPMAMTILVLSIPYLRIALDVLADIFEGVWVAGSLTGLWGMAGVFVGLALLLGGYILE